ncbi:MAG: type II secretion system protein [Sedimentisphaerales bacterium]|nr:type II secretion system protein [Sedimentisphaerales bacterium]
MLTKDLYQIKKQGSRAFTLVELLVVIAIIGLLLSILMPSLTQARRSAQAVKCSVNQKNVGMGMASYVVDNKGYYPASYTYGPNNQGTDDVEGYYHWSGFIYGKENGYSSVDAFKCPSMKNGGAPRTNPGYNRDNWEDGQVDAAGNTQPSNSPEDNQAPRMALTANQALIPRNKFNTLLSESTYRTDSLVKEGAIKDRPGELILAAEFNQDWKALTVIQGNNRYLCKSHRPVCAFVTATGAANGKTYWKNSPQLGYMYPPKSQNFWLADYETYQQGGNWLDSDMKLNSVGRHHAPDHFIVEGVDYGGSSNFLYVDGHVERLHVYETLDKRHWGKYFYSMSGTNSVYNYRW